LHVDIQAWHVENFEHDLSHFLSVELRVQRGFRHQNGMLFGGNAQFAVECVMPNFLHIVPVGDNSVLNWGLNLENTSLLLGLLANINFSLVETNHDSWYLGSANDCREDGAGSIVSSKTCFASA